jgi:hypothetical protein
VTFAVDWVAQQLASKLRYLDRVAVVTAASDSMDPSPDRIAFSTVWEAEDWVAEEVARRVQYQVDHSPHTVSEDDLMDMQEQECAFFRSRRKRGFDMEQLRHATQQCNRLMPYCPMATGLFAKGLAVLSLLSTHILCHRLRACQRPLQGRLIG